jgi:DNA-binding transcriptional LysR family regulator
LTPRFVFESDINATVLGFVANGYGAAIVPRLMVHPPDDRVRIVQLEPSLRMSRRIALVRDRHRRNVPGAAEFEAVAHRTFAGLLVEGSDVAPRLA